jgi:uncharacterized protein (TIGR00369 family)
MPTTPAPRNPNFADETRANFKRQKVMAFIGAEMTEVSPGIVEISLAVRDELTQQNDYIHAGIVTTIVDSACGYAALTLAPANCNVLTVEYKVNFIAPAQGERLKARGHVIRAGRTITVCAGDVFALRDGIEHLVAVMQGTMMLLPGNVG